MAKHTPGKWEVDENNDVSVGWEKIAFLRSSTKNQERIANARLIAHAPAMLEMLQTIVEDMEQYDGATISIKDIKELIKSATTE